VEAAVIPATGFSRSKKRIGSKRGSSSPLVMQQDQGQLPQLRSHRAKPAAATQVPLAVEWRIALLCGGGRRCEQQMLLPQHSGGSKHGQP